MKPRMRWLVDIVSTDMNFNIKLVRRYAVQMGIVFCILLLSSCAAPELPSSSALDEDTVSVLERLPVEDNIPQEETYPDNVMDTQIDRISEYLDFARQLINKNTNEDIIEQELIIDSYKRVEYDDYVFADVMIIREPFPPSCVNVLVVDTGTALLGEYIGYGFAELYFEDINNDTYDEAIYYYCQFGTSDLSCMHHFNILQLTSDNLIPIMSSNYDYLASDFDTGFRIQYLDGAKFEIFNIFTNDNYQIAAEDFFIAETEDSEYYEEFRCFDKNGKVLPDKKGKTYHNLDSGNFQSIKFLDVDMDGALEVLAYEWLIVEGRTRGIIGDGYYVMKYNMESNSMEVIRTVVLPDYIRNQAFWSDLPQPNKYSIYLSYFENNWYRDQNILSEMPSG